MKLTKQHTQRHVEDNRRRRKEGRGGGGGGGGEVIRNHMARTNKQKTETKIKRIALGTGGGQLSSNTIKIIIAA